MSNGKDKKVKPGMSFEDVLKKIATTKMDPAILIEEKDIDYEITKSADKKVLLTKIEIPDQEIDTYSIIIKLIDKNNRIEKGVFTLSKVLDDKKKDYTVLVKGDKQGYNNPIDVTKDQKLLVSITDSSEVFSQRKFDKGILYYRIL